MVCVLTVIMLLHDYTLIRARQTLDWGKISHTISITYVAGFELPTFAVKFKYFLLCHLLTTRMLTFKHLFAVGTVKFKVFESLAYLKCNWLLTVFQRAVALLLFNLALVLI